MKLIWANSEFCPNGVPAQGFPILLTRDGQIDPVVHSYLVTQLLQSGRAASPATWSNTGYALLSYLSYLERIGRNWADQRRSAGTPSLVADYRRHLLERGSNRSSVNARLDAIVSFYLFALEKNHINELPFALREARTGVQRGSHSVVTRDDIKLVPDVKLTQPRTTIKVLSAYQAKCFLAGFKSKTLRLIAKLQVETGVRVEEAVSFPVKYVVNPQTFPEVKALFVVTLSPRDMQTKGGVARNIHIPRALMADLWMYVAVERQTRILNDSATELFLTKEGRRYKTRSVWKLYSENMGAGLHVYPHLLRHTYATHTLAAVSKIMNVGNALLYVRDRLGHSSIKTTEVYLHYKDDIAVAVSEQYQAELSRLA